MDISLKSCTPHTLSIIFQGEIKRTESSEKHDRMQKSPLVIHFRSIYSFCAIFFLGGITESLFNIGDSLEQVFFLVFHYGWLINHHVDAIVNQNIQMLNAVYITRIDIYGPFIANSLTSFV